MPFRFFLVITFVVSFAVTAEAQCIRQSMLNHDYCGPEASKLARLVPDQALGNFRAACARHDQCYQFGGEAIVQQMEQRYLMSMMAMTDKQKREFRKEMADLQKQCDRAFGDNLMKSCHMLDQNCRKSAAAYYAAVRTLGHRWFAKATENAFTCRTR